MKTVYPNAIRPITPFKKPVQAITTPITDDDNILLCVDRDWLPVLRGAISVLVEPIHWNGTQADVDYAIEQIHQLLEMMNMSSCGCVKSCITNNPDIISIIQDITYGTPDNPIPLNERQKNFTEGLGCDYDSLWSSCQYVIDGVFGATTEVLERIALATTPFEGISKATDDIPILGFLTNAGDLINWITETAHQAWVAADSQGVRDTLACELNCYAQINCGITFDDLERVFSRRAKDLPIGLFTLDDQIAWLAGIIFSTEAPVIICSTIGMLGIFVMKYGGKFGQYAFSIRTLEQLARIGYEDNPNNSWTILCGSCTYVWIEPFNDIAGTTWELVDIDGNGLLSTHYNEFGNPAPSVESVKWYDPVYGGYQWRAKVKINLPQICTVTDVSYDWRYTGGSTRAVGLQVDYFDVNDVNLGFEYIAPTESIDTWHIINFNAANVQNVSYVVVSVGNSSITNELTWLHWLDNVKVTYFIP